MAQLRWSQEAAGWLQEIYSYIAQENSAAADKVVAGIYEKAQLLIDFPEIGYRYRKEPEGEIRILLYGHYRLAYLITEDFVDILGIFHGALDIEKYLP